MVLTFLKAGILANQGKIKQAVQNYQKLLLIKPDMAKAHHNLAGLLRTQGNIDLAIEHYKIDISHLHG
jgi:tetratricopeptide (TPR) repeat protein